MTKIYGLDTGTCRTRIYDADSGMILNEASAVAIHKETKEILAVGTDAENMTGRTHSRAEIIHPIQNGIISDFDITREMLRSFFYKISPKGIHRPNIALCVPSGIGSVHFRSLREAVERAGGRVLKTYDNARCISAGMADLFPYNSGAMIADLGGGITQICTVYRNFTVNCRIDYCGGNFIDEKIQDFLRNEKQITPGTQNIKKLKHNMLNNSDETFEIFGKDKKSGLPKKIQITRNEITSAVYPAFSHIADTVSHALCDTPADLLGDIAANGIYLCGGVSLFAGIGDKIHTSTGISCITLPTPTEYGAMGAVKLSSLKNGEFIRS